ncbi:collagen alpha-2(I) chain-like [Pieris rapae]|uniref:collagen alpha-2(I) chain-like n=1 Tax=Pieris rapae TaxID=64459 RepID=UPI001E27A86A|nr:collagen alpha-2(I) chain-like [Pieris rapae]
MGPYITVSGIYCILAVTSVAQAEQWRWRSDERSGESQEAPSVRIDNKVRFEDSAADHALYSDEMAGFHNRPFADSALVADRAAAGESQGTLDDLMYCRCERAPVRNLQCVMGSRKGCSSHEYLCCSSLATQDPNRADRPLAVGPEGPTGVLGPFNNINTDSGESASAQRGFYSPGGASGFIDFGFSRPILVGPGGPTGIIGSRRQGVLVGPGGPTGIIGPAGFNRGYGASRPGILVGPGGPTGIIGPGRQGVLVGPGGPTGIIGPAGFNREYGASRPGILVGPGGPTGRVGPERQVLVGPGGPTGQIGPRRSFGK